MSVSKKDQVFPSGSAASNEQFVAALIAKALREDVSMRSARADISALIEKRLVLFIGGNRTGKYELVSSQFYR